jgi:hypothetical protein
VPPKKQLSFIPTKKKRKEKRNMHAKASPSPINC